MNRQGRPSSFMKEQSRLVVTGKYMQEDWKKKKKLSKEFLRTQYGLEVKKK